jgi:predicted TIM-barrel fold metal-dependent hydrolase
MPNDGEQRMSREPNSASDSMLDPGFLDEEWLSRVEEEVIAPGLPVVDPHHHIWWNDRQRAIYQLQDFVADVMSGHNVIGSVFLQTRAMYRATGPEPMRVVGEVEFVRGLRAMSASGDFGPLGLFSGIVGACDLTSPGFRDVLAAEEQAGGGYFKGIRVGAQRDSEAGKGWAVPPREHLMLDPAIQAGVAALAERGLTCDLMCFHPQLAEAAKLAEAAPDTRIVLNHMGGPLGVGAWAGRQDEVRRDWADGLRLAAAHQNVWLKVGGLANPYFGGIMFRDRELPPSSEELAAAYRPWFEQAVDIFGPGRIMFESNFPADRTTVSYQVVWNAFKRLGQRYSDAEQRAMLAGTAIDFYRLDLPAGPVGEP